MTIGNKKVKIHHALEGITIIDLSRLLSGPLCTMMLGDMGADVIKIEPVSGEDSRFYGPPFIENESCAYLCANRNKRDIALDITTEKGKELFFRLVSKADVVVENFRPDIRERLKINYSRIIKYNPKVIYCSISGFGEKGPYREKPGVDIIFQGMGGIMTITGEPNSPPTKVGTPVADATAGMLAAFGILTALFHRERTGIGQKVEISLLGSLLFLQSPLVSIYFGTRKNPPRYFSGGGPAAVPSQYFKTKDSYVTLSAYSKKFWIGLCKVLGMKELIDDPRFRTNPDRVKNREKLIPIIQKRFLKKRTKEWIALLEKEEVPCGRILNYEEVFSNPQVMMNEMIETIDHPKCGKITLAGIPVKLEKTPGAVKKPPPILGQHTEEILKEFGITDAEMNELLKLNIIRK